MDVDRTALLGVGMAVGYATVMACHPARASFRNGARCLVRYPEVWWVLSAFGLAYALWQLGLEVYFSRVLPEGARPVFHWGGPFFLPWAERRAALAEAVLPAAEGVSGIFNNVVTTYPISAVVGLLFLSNRGGHAAELFRALVRRFGAVWGGVCHGLIAGCALAALAKPAMYAVLPLWAEQAGVRALQVSLVVDWMSFLFEYLVGVAVQVYLILMAHAWLRGAGFERGHLVGFALRRFSSVVRWAAVVMALSTVVIHLPQILLAFPAAGDFIQRVWGFDMAERYARPALAVFLVAFFGMQVSLTFHSEGLLQAVAHHFAFVRRHGWRVIWYLVVAGFHCYALEAAGSFVLRGAGETTLVGVCWRLLYPVVSGLLWAWLLVSWVSLYRSCETGHSRFDELVKY